MTNWKSMFFRLVELARSEKTVNDEAEIIGWATHEDGQHYPIHAAQGGGSSSGGGNKNNSYGKEGKNKSTSKENNEKKIPRPKNEQNELKQFNVYDTSTKTDNEKLAQINPNYNKGTREYTNNCQKCVMARELQERGYDVEAKPFNANDSVKDNIFTLVDFDASNYKSDNGFSIIKTRNNLDQTANDCFNKWGDGSRAIVRLEWAKQHGGEGHFIYAKRENGKTVYEDPQSGKRVNINDYASRCTPYYNKMWIMRIDNRKVTSNIKDAVKNREGEK